MPQYGVKPRPALSTLHPHQGTKWSRYLSLKFCTSKCKRWPILLGRPTSAAFLGNLGQWILLHSELQLKSWGSFDWADYSPKSKLPASIPAAGRRELCPSWTVSFTSQRTHDFADSNGTRAKRMNFPHFLVAILRVDNHLISFHPLGL